MKQYFVQVQDYLVESAKRYPNKCAVALDETRLTYAALNNKADQLALYFIEQGLQAGDRVVVCLNNPIQVAISFWAILKAGGVGCIIHDALGVEKIKAIVLDCDARFLIGHQSLNASMLSVFQGVELRCVESQVGFAAEGSVTQCSKNKGYKTCFLNQTVFDQLDHVTFSPVVCKRLDIDLAAIIYTSGSTGLAKGVMMTHRNILAASASINQYLEHSETDIILSALPFSFDYGLYQLIMAVSVGATLILERNFLLPLNFMKKIIAEQITVLPVVPTMITLLDDYAKKFGMAANKIRCITNTGAALNKSHAVGLRKLFPKADIVSMYGVTECKRCSYLPAIDFDRKPGSIGLAIPNTQLWVVDPEGKPLGPNQIGELVIRGATIMQGYWNNPISTAKKLKIGLLPTEKILYTGDYCWLDEEGYLYFHGRMDEIFKSRGVKIVPKKIEDLLLSLEQVKEAVVVGVEDQSYGHAVFAFVTLHTITDELFIKQAIQTKLSAPECPKKIIILSVLPKTAHGKYDRIKLKQMISL